MRQITEIIIHCSATRAGRHFTVADISRWHRERGFRTIGYHWVIYLDGSLHAGRPEAEQGAHCLHHNAHSIGICYIGGLDDAGRPADTRTLRQKETLVKLIADLRRRFPAAKVYPHSQFAAKACPCFDVASL